MNESMEFPQEPNGVPARRYSLAECILAWLCWLAGYLFWRVFPRAPLGSCLLIFALFAGAAILGKRNGVKFGAVPVLMALSALLITPALFLGVNPTLCCLIFLYVLAVFCYVFSVASGGRVTAPGFSALVAVDFFKVLFIAPFYAFGELFPALFTGKARSGGRLLLKLLIGIAVAVIPTLVVLVLLSYDSGFSSLLGSLFSFRWTDLFSHLLSVALAIPVGMYLFGLYASSRTHRYDHILTAESCHSTVRQLRVAPAVTVLAAVVPLLCVYVIFFVSQWQYYISGFTGALPDDFSYAEYAREGFFQLCVVAVLNLFLMLAVILFLRRRADRPSWLLKLLCAVFSVFTLILISTAIAKMVLYIDCYGLTQKRVYATWLMVALAVLFLLILLRQFLPRLNLAAVSFAVCFVLFAVPALSNVEGQIARYNVSRYIDGSLETVDLQAFDELGIAGVPELARLTEFLEERGSSKTAEERKLYEDAAERLQDATGRVTDRDFFSWTLPWLRARASLEQK